MIARSLSHSSPGASVHYLIITALLASSLVGQQSFVAEGTKVKCSFPAARVTKPLDGRLLVLFSKDSSSEPRFQLSNRTSTAQVFGRDIDQLEPSESRTIDDRAFGYPIERIGMLPMGKYRVQAILHRYETFTRADGHRVKLPMDRGEGQHWNRAPGNLYSKPIDVELTLRQTIELSLDLEIPPIARPKDTKYIKHLTIRSERLSKFWGRPMELGACILLPEGFDEHPEARYPLVVNHGHFPHTFSGFRPSPPDEDLVDDYSDRFHMSGYNRIQQQEAHDFFKRWTGPDMPRIIIIKVQHANPYYDDSYAVNSENLGPYGDAIQYELIPHIEKLYRGLGAGWARFTYGGSTGGWEALAVQILYPDEYNGCFAACPDPIDFRAYTVVDIYKDKNAYYDQGPFHRVARPGQRNYLGHVSTTLEQMNRRELALGTHSRSGDQWDIWEAVYSPVGKDGYPKRIWNKLTGEIDHEVAEYWRENYDLRHILQRDWKTLGPKLHGKMHIYCGTMDNYYLNNAVYLMEAFLNQTKAPQFGGLVDYGARAEHCWNGDHEQPNAISRLRYHTMYVDKMMARIEKAAPEGADLKSWRY